MEDKIVLNKRLMNWIYSVIEDMIESTIEDTPEKFSTFIVVNDMLNKLGNIVDNEDMSDLISETLVNKIFDEIKISL